jgi:hypothetical protein
VAPTRAITLAQVIAVRKGVVARTHSEISRLHLDVQKQALINGMTRTYRKISDTDPDLPGDDQRVQLRADDVLNAARDALVKLFDTTAVIDYTNQVAKADVVVGDRVLVPDAPVSWLLFLEKQLVDIATFVRKLPVLDPAEQWHWDSNADAWASAKSTTVRNKKVPRNHVVVAATDKHPAQVQVYQEDIPVGYWDTIKFSGAVDGGRVKTILDRVRTLSDAVKMAREQANSREAVTVNVGAGIFGYLFAA